MASLEGTITTFLNKTLITMIALASSAVPLAAADATGVTFTLSPNVNNWWVEVSTNAAPTSIRASVDGGPAIALTHEWWGGWGVSTHVAAGSHVVFTADVGGQTATSTAYVWPDVATTHAILPIAGGSSTSSSAGESSSFSQQVDIPPDNVIAALALGNSGLFGLRSIADIANIQRTASSSAFKDQNVNLDTNDVLLALALGNRGVSPFLLTGSMSSLTDCLQQRALVQQLRLGTSSQFSC